MLQAATVIVIMSLGDRQRRQCHDHKEEGEESGMDREPDAVGDSGAAG
jgi:hypothetical protein